MNDYYIKSKISPKILEVAGLKVGDRFKCDLPLYEETKTSTAEFIVDGFIPENVFGELKVVASPVGAQGAEAIMVPIREALKGQIVR